jgi:hypothetical protein
MHERNINKTQLCVGASALFLGFLVYLVARPSDTYFLSLLKVPNRSWTSNSTLFNEIAGVVSSFLHVFAFSLMLGGLLACETLGYLLICSSWFVVNALFELGQKYAISASHRIPDSLERGFLLGNVKTYFLKGTFDYFDLLAGCIGAMVAYLILVKTTHGRRK